MSDFDEEEERHLFHLFRSLRVKKPVGPCCPVRRLLLGTVLRRRRGVVRQCHVRRCVVVVAASKDEEKKDDTYFSSSSLLVTSAMVSWPSGLCAAFPREPTATDTYLHPPSPVASMYLRKAAGIFILFVAHTVTDFIAIVAVFSPLPVSVVA